MDHMKVVVAMDSFKGSMTSMEAGMAAREGILRACKADVIVKPLADGGEGTTEALLEGLGGTCEYVEVTGPLGDKVQAHYGIIEDGKTAVMEMAEAAGIILIGKEQRDPWKATTVGVGEMILDAIGKGCRKFVIGLGGSATTEGGIGMLTALGYQFYDAEGKELPPEFSSLGKIAEICADAVVPELQECRFQIACDVANPLCGENGAVYVYGPQKGVRQEERQSMDEAMRFYADKTAAFWKRDNSMARGSGAAGGMGFAFLSYIPQAEMKPGISIVLEAIRLEEELRDADVVLTGEGQLDAQTAFGKVPIGVAELAKKYGVRTIAFAGGITDDAGLNHEKGIDAFFPTVRGVTTLEEAMEPGRAKRNLTLAVEQVFRILNS